MTLDRIIEALEARRCIATERAERAEDRENDDGADRWWDVETALEDALDTLTVLRDDMSTWYGKNF